MIDWNILQITPVRMTGQEFLTMVLSTFFKMSGVLEFFQST